LALFPVGNPAIQVGGGILGIDLQGFGEISDGLVVLAFDAINLAPGDIGLRIFGVDFKPGNKSYLLCRGLSTKTRSLTGGRWRDKTSPNAEPEIQEKIPCIGTLPSRPWNLPGCKNFN
jgi:hypothetical protein